MDVQSAFPLVFVYWQIDAVCGRGIGGTIDGCAANGPLAPDCDRQRELQKFRSKPSPGDAADSITTGNAHIMRAGLLSGWGGHQWMPRQSELLASAASITAWGRKSYRPLESTKDRQFILRPIPYYAWANRGTGKTIAWLPVR
jgi:hypothetical protein